MSHVRLRTRAVSPIGTSASRDVKLSQEIDNFIPACKFSTGYHETCDLVCVIVVPIPGKAIIITKGFSACLSSEECLVWPYHYYWKVFIDISGVMAAGDAVLSVLERMQIVSERHILAFHYYISPIGKLRPNGGAQHDPSQCTDTHWTKGKNRIKSSLVFLSVADAFSFNCHHHIRLLKDITVCHYARKKQNCTVH